MQAHANQSLYGHAQYFAALDGFRGLLALTVAIYHTIWISTINSSAFFNNGPVIIDLFFVFSGFLMFTLYARKLKDAASARSFLVKRFARLYPLHLFMLAVFVAFAAARLWAHKIGLASHQAGEILPFQAGADENWRALIAHLTMTHAMGGADSLTFNPPSWTIGAEFYTYFLFIGFMLLMARRTFGKGIALGLTAAIAGVYAVLAGLKPDMDITYDLGVLRCAAGFFIGVLAARLFQNGPSKIVTRHASLIEALVLAGSVAFVIFCAGKAQFLVGPVLFLFVYVFAHDGGVISRLMSGRIFGFLARISYSVYMIHVIIAIFFGIFAERFIAGNFPNWNVSGWGGDLLLIPYLACVILASYLTYKFVEIPGGRFLRRLFSPKSTPRDLPAALKGEA